MKNDFLTLDETAGRLRLKIDTVRRIIRRGEMTAAKIGRSWLVSETEVNRYVSDRVRHPQQ